MADQRRHCNDHEQHDPEHDDRTERERECLPAFLDESLRLVALERDVDARDERGHPGRRAPQCEHDRNERRDREAGARGVDDLRELVDEEVAHVHRKRLAEILDLPHDVALVREEPIDRHERDQRRHEREEPVEGDARRDQCEVVLADALRDPLPALLRAPQHTRRIERLTRRRYRTGGGLSRSRTPSTGRRAIVAVPGTLTE